MEREVTRSGTPIRRHRVGRGRDRAGLLVEPVGQHAIDAEVRRDDIAIGGVRDDAVRVRAFLTLRLGALALVVHDRPRLAKPAVLPNGERGDRAAHVVRDEYRVTSAIDRHVAWRLACLLYTSPSPRDRP